MALALLAVEGCFLAEGGPPSGELPRPSPTRVTPASPAALATLTAVAPTAVVSPPSPGTTGASARYTARAGDTLGGLARRFGVAVADLARVNNIPTDEPLRPGQDLRLPEGVWSGQLGIRLTRPEPGGRVRAPILVEGSAATFESLVVVEVLGGDGARLSQESTKAASPEVGLHGPFRVTLSLPSSNSDRTVTLRIYWPSPRDGTPQDEIRVPVTVLASG